MKRPPKSPGIRKAIAHVKELADYQHQKLDKDPDWKEFLRRRDQRGMPEYVTDELQDDILMGTYGTLLNYVSGKDLYLLVYPSWKLMILDSTYETAEENDMPFNDAFAEIIKETLNKKVGVENPNN